MKKMLYSMIGLLFLNTSFANLESVTDNYVNQLKLSQQESDKAEKQTAYNKTKEYAKTLLGVVQDIDINFLNKANGFYKLLLDKAIELQKNKNSEDRRVSLRANRDITNFNEISKYLKCCSKLLNTLYKQPDIIDLILGKISEFIPQLGREITIMLRVFELVMEKPEENFDNAIEKMRNFAKQSEDGTYLLSPILSVAMSYDNPDSLDFKQIIQETDFSNLDLCNYLNIK